MNEAFNLVYDPSVKQLENLRWPLIFTIVPRPKIPKDDWSNKFLCVQALVRAAITEEKSPYEGGLSGKAMWGLVVDRFRTELEHTPEARQGVNLLHKALRKEKPKKKEIKKVYKKLIGACPSTDFDVVFSSAECKELDTFITVWLKGSELARRLAALIATLEAGEMDPVSLDALREEYVIFQKPPHRKHKVYLSARDTLAQLGVEFHQPDDLSLFKKARVWLRARIVYKSLVDALREYYNDPQFSSADSLYDWWRKEVLPKFDEALDN